MTSALPFDDIRALIAGLPGADDSAAAAARRRIVELEPVGRLGRIGETAAWFAAWSGRMPPVVARPLVAIFAGTHGVAVKGVSTRPPSWTAAMVEHCAAGGAAANQACLANDVALKVFDLALDLPTRDITEDAALDERACAATMAFGMEAVAEGADLLVVSDISVGGSTVAAAMFAALLGGSAKDWVGAGADAAILERRILAVEAALERHRGHLKDPLEVLRRLGGRELAAIAGAILAARVQKVPVILDGLAATTAAAVLHAVSPAAIAHCRLAALTGQHAHAGAASRLGLAPMLDLGAPSEGGAAGALAAGVVRTACLCLSGMRPLPAAGN